MAATRNGTLLKQGDEADVPMLKKTEGKKKPATVPASGSSSIVKIPPDKKHGGETAKKSPPVISTLSEKAQENTLVKLTPPNQSNRSPTAPPSNLQGQKPSKQQDPQPRSISPKSSWTVEKQDVASPSQQKDTPTQHLGDRLGGHLGEKSSITQSVGKPTAKQKAQPPTPKAKPKMEQFKPLLQHEDSQTVSETEPQPKPRTQQLQPQTPAVLRTQPLQQHQNLRDKPTQVYQHQQTPQQKHKEAVTKPTNPSGLESIENPVASCSPSGTVREQPQQSPTEKQQQQKQQKQLKEKSKRPTSTTRGQTPPSYESAVKAPPPRPSRPCCYYCCCWCHKTSTTSDTENDDNEIGNRLRTATTTTKSSKHSSSLKPSAGRAASLEDDASQITSVHGARTVQPRGRQCCRIFLTFLFSQIGMGALVVAYSIMGGVLFRYLESTEEYRQRANVTAMRNDSVKALWNITEELNVLYEKNWTILAHGILRDFQDQVSDAVKSGSWDGRDLDEHEKWSFAGSLLYCITVITTIGYGHITPQTDNGKIATIFYALFGIPLTLLCLSNIGTAFANCFRFLYYHLCRCLCCKPCGGCDDDEDKKKSKAGGGSGGPGGSGGKTSHHPVSNKGLSGVDTVDNTYGGRGGSRKGRARPGDPEDPAASRPLNTDSSTCPSAIESGGKSSDKSKPSRFKKEAPKSVHREKFNTAQVRVPVTVSLLIMALYILGGALLFSTWETKWDPLIGAYFCFITLSTIGFGDYVFGDGSDLATNEKTIICALYLVLGLSIIAMCFNLMQEEVLAKSRWLGEKLGILEKGRT